MDILEVIFVTSSDSVISASAWNVTTGSQLAQYRGGGSAPPHCFAVTGGRVFTCEKGKPLLTSWLVNRQHSESTRLLAGGRVSCFAFSEDSSLAAIAVGEKVHLYQTGSGKLLGSGLRHFQSINVVKFNSDNLICCGGEDGLITIWNAGTLSSSGQDSEPQFSYHEHTLPVTDLCWTSTGSNPRVISVSSDRSLKVYSLKYRQIQVSVVFEVRLTSVAVLPSEISAFVGTVPGEIHEVNLHGPPRSVETQPALEPITGHTEQITCLAPTDDSLHLVSGSFDATVRIWHIQSRQCLRKITLKGPVHNLYLTRLPKMVFSQKYKSFSVLKNFLRPANDDGEEVGIDILMEDDLACKPLAVFSQSINSGNQTERKLTIEKLKQINDSLYQFGLKKILHAPMKKKRRFKKPVFTVK